MLLFADENQTVINGLLLFSIASSVLFLMVMRARPSLTRAIVKTVSIIALVVLVYVQGAPVALIIALSFAAFGDFFLAFEGEANFKIGLAGFLLAQVALVATFIHAFSGGWPLLQAEPWRFLLLAGVLANSVNLGSKLWRLLPRSMGGPVIFYAAVITLMGLSSLVYAPPLVVIGALLFIVSDSLIAYERFILDTPVNHHPWISPAVWITYYSAQLLITVGVLSSLSRLY